MASNSVAYEFEHAGKHYRWDRNTLRSSEGRAEIRRVLPEYVRGLGYKASNADIDLANRVLGVLGGNVDEAQLTKIEQQVTEVMNASAPQEADEMADRPEPGKEPFREIAAIMKMPEARIALQRRDTGQPLDERQAAVVARHDELLRLNNERARKEQAMPTPAKPGPWVSPNVLSWVRSKDVIVRRNGAAEHSAKVLGDPSHPYWNASSTEHKAAVLAMKVANEIIQTGETTVRVGDDGAIIDE